MTKSNKLIEQIVAILQIAYPSPRFVEEIIHNLGQKTTDIHSAVNITFEQDEKDTLKINIEGRGTVEPFLKTLDIVLIHIREKEMQNKKRNQSET